MSSDQRQLSFPPGTELVFGPQAARRQWISDTIAAVFRGWGFDEIVLPSFDADETFDGLGAESELYGLTDREGRRLTLRADFTLIASKAIALELRRANRQIRASYEGRVYRFAPSGHGHRVEQTQRGLEWVNVRGLMYDAAVLAMVRECLDAVGAADAVIVVGHAGFIHAALGVQGDHARRLLEAIDHKNPSRIRQLAQRAGLAAAHAALLADLPLLTGGPEVFKAARAHALSAAAGAALGELQSLHTLLTQAGVADRLIVDLGEVRRSDYYSGFMFKIYQQGVGDDLGGGGRYDRLFDRFGIDVPAVGFGFDLARLAETTTRNDYSGVQSSRVADSEGAAGLKKLLTLRTAGKTVELGGA